MRQSFPWPRDVAKKYTSDAVPTSHVRVARARAKTPPSTHAVQHMLAGSDDDVGKPDLRRRSAITPPSDGKRNPTRSPELATGVDNPATKAAPPQCFFRVLTVLFTAATTSSDSFAR